MQAVTPQPGWTEASEAIRHATITNELANRAGTVGWTRTTDLLIHSQARFDFPRFHSVSNPLIICISWLRPPVSDFTKFHWEALGSSQ
jgi:hypothetical protein